MATKSGRAAPLTAQERRASIVAAACELLTAHGPDVTTRQIADAAGVAEGTLFRVFADKQEILDAAVAQFLDPAPVVAELAAIDTSASLEHRLLRVVEITHARFVGVTGVMAATGGGGGHKHHDSAHHDHEVRSAAAQLFDQDRDGLRIEPTALVHYLRMLSFASACPAITGAVAATPKEIVDLVLRGVVTEKD